MADNVDPAPAAPADGSDPSAANLRIITMANGSNRENDLFITVPLAYTIRELKDHIRTILEGQPPAEEQRLIYLGHSLRDNAATLRSILRLQGAEQTTTHSLHLVIRPDAATFPTSNQSSTPLPTSQLALQQPQVQEHQARYAAQAAQLPNVFQNMLNTGYLADHPTNVMQQQLAFQNQHVADPHLRANRGNVHQMHITPPGFGPIGPDPAAARRNRNLRTSNRDQPQIGVHHPVTNAPASTIPFQQHGMPTRAHEPIESTGDYMRIVANNDGPALHREPHHGLHSNLVERSAGAPAPPPLHGATQFPMMPFNAPPFPYRQFHFPRAMPPHMPPAIIHGPFAPSTVWLVSSPNGPQAVLFAPGHGYFSTAPISQYVAQPSRTSTDTNTTSTSSSEQLSSDGQNDDTVMPGQTQTRPQQNNPEQARPRGDLVLRPQDQPQPQIQANPPAVRQNRQGGEIAAFVIQRGWLFLRLYMFIFILSEAGTWRRIILLAVATLVCFLPERNPLTDAFNVARQHFDNLVGPPRLVARHNINRGGLENGAAAGAAQNGGRPRPNAMPTPEEHARRLLREHRDGDQSFIRGLLRPVEQAVTLFLASLIPGVGERHVRAHEEARQLIAQEARWREVEAGVQRLQEQRSSLYQPGQRATDSDNATAPIDVETRGEDVKPAEPSAPASGPSQNEATASSTGVEVTSSDSSSTRDEGVRQRNNEPNQAPPNLIADW